MLSNFHLSGLQGCSCIRLSQAHHKYFHMMNLSEKLLFTQTDASFFLSLPMACVWVSMRGRCLGLGSDENRSSKSTSDASAEPKKEAVFRYIASSCFECFPAIK